MLSAVRPAGADVLLLTVGSGTREMQCVILEETETAFRVRIKLGGSTIPKARLAGVLRATEAENAALLAEWEAAKAARGGHEAPPEPVVDGPIPPPDRTESRELNVAALVERYGFDGLQDGFDYDPLCPESVDWCEARIRKLGALHHRELGLAVGDRVLGMNHKRFPRGAALDTMLQGALTRAVNGQRTWVHLVRDGRRLDIEYASN